ncbi:hypothetical protein [Pseudomonas rossensis]|uniref:hypothetical protein n=1 Tax=Pseudomonas rossensis TaxID=2305471 RepID=UPI003260319A
MEDVDNSKVIQQEYFHLQSAIDAFDSRALTIKAWSVTFGFATLVGSAIFKEPAVSFVVFISGLLFWCIEASWKTFQDAYYQRVKVLEAYFEKPTGAVVPLQIHRAWNTAYKANRASTFAKVLLYPHVMLPHVAVALFGLVFYIYFPVNNELPASVFPIIEGPQPMTLKDLIMIIVTVIGVPAALLAAWKALVEFRVGNTEKHRENRHKQASAAKDELKSLFCDPLSHAAMKMTDWTGRYYMIDGTSVPILSEDVISGLRTHNLNFSRKELFIRDCFESFFDHVLMIEHLVSIDYINYEDIEVPLKYYASKIALNLHIYNDFLTDYGYQKSKELFLRAAHVTPLPAANV